MQTVEEWEKSRQNIDDALRVLAFWDFELRQQAKVFGIDHEVGTCVSYLQAILKKSEEGDDIAERAGLIIEAGARVDKLIDAGNIGLKVRWLETRLASLGKSPKMAMLEDGLEGLRRFVEVLRNCT